MIKFPTEYPFSKVDDVGLFLAKTGPGQFHVGFLYKNKTGAPEIYHFTGEALESGAPASDYCWFDLGACFKRRQRAILLASLWTFIDANIDANVRYGFDNPEGAVDADFKIDQTDTRGFTCASIVLSIFERFGFNLLKYDEWPEDSPENVKWQRFFLQRVITPRYGAEFANAQSALIGMRRFLPYEVAAATQVIFPAGHEGAHIMGGLVRDLVEKFSSSVRTV